MTTVVPPPPTRREGVRMMSNREADEDAEKMDMKMLPEPEDPPTPLSVALENGHMEVAELLRAHGATEGGSAAAMEVE